MSNASHLPLMMQARRELGLWQNIDLARFLGTSVRTMQRHPGAWGVVTLDGHQRIIRALYPKNPAMAEEVAKSRGTSCAALGLHAPAAAPAPTPTPAALNKPLATQDHATLVVCAAADALNLVPRAVRPALAAIFGQARSLGVDMDSLAKLLADGEPKAKKA